MSDTSTTSTTSSEPWGPTQQPLEDIIGAAGDLYGTGGYIGPNNFEMAGLGQTIQAAATGSPLLQPAMSNATSMMTGPMPGMTNAQYNNMAPISDVATGQNYISSGDNIYNMASGGMIGASNPYTMQNLDIAAAEAADMVNSTFNGSGRYGSDVNQDVLGETVGDIYSTGLMNQTNIDLQNQLAANQQLTGIQGANIANRVGAATTLNDMFNQGNQLALQYTLAAPMLDEMRYSDASHLLQAGGALRAEDQAAQMYPWDELARYRSMVTGLPFGTQTSTAPQGSPIAGAMGGASLGASAYGSLGLTAMNPWLAGGMIGLGGLGGLMM